MKEFVVQALAVSKIVDAYGLARLSLPGLELGAWRRYALNILKHSHKKEGILMIRRVARAHICGLVSYRGEMDLQLGRVLQAQHLSAIDMLDSSAILLALLDHLSGIARRLHCKIIRISLPDAEPGRTDLYDALLQLRPRLALERRFGVDWQINPAAASPGLI